MDYVQRLQIANLQLELDIVVAQAVLRQRRRRRRNRTIWVKPWLQPRKKIQHCFELQRRNLLGQYERLMAELRDEDIPTFRNFLTIPSLVRSVCPSFAGGSRSACPRVDSSSDTTGLGSGLSLAGGSGDFFDFAEVFLFGMTGFVKGRRDNDIWCHNLANCHMPTTKSCTFVGDRVATIALPA